MNCRVDRWSRCSLWQVRRVVVVVSVWWSVVGLCESFSCVWRNSKRCHCVGLKDARYEVGEDGRPVESKRERAYFSVQTPHSGRHFDVDEDKRRRRRRKRFTEGWYYRLTLPDVEESFVFIFSIEDPSGGSELSLVCMQAMGPGDEYLVQSDTDVSKFWAWKHAQAFGCTFSHTNDDPYDTTKAAALSPAQWRQTARSGFQILPHSIQGRLIGHDGTLGGVHRNQGIPGNCTFDLSIAPIHGWGTRQSTAGWLANYRVFDPHWQITLAHAYATGTVTWKGKLYDVQQQPFYAEKNWGEDFPIKWYWTQCNSFTGYPHLSVTSGGGIRKLPLLGTTENLGMIGIHYNHTFYEAVPWTGNMTWKVHPWGSWELYGRVTSHLTTNKFETKLVATCTNTTPGVLLRAPTKYDGMVYFCRDSFYANITLSLSELVWNVTTNDYDAIPLIRGATSNQGGVEVGGGPWWDTWEATSKMKQPFKGMVLIPYYIKKWTRNLPFISKRNDMNDNT